MSGGGFGIFFTRPLSAAFIIGALILLGIPVVRGGKKILFERIPKED